MDKNGIQANLCFYHSLDFFITEGAREKVKSRIQKINYYRLILLFYVVERYFL